MQENTGREQSFPQRHCKIILLLVIVSVIFLFWPFLFSHGTSQTKRDENTAWHPPFNTYQAIKYAYALSFNVSNCWICTAIPTVHGGLMLGTVPLGANDTWTNLLFETSEIAVKDKIALPLMGRQNGTVCFQRSGKIKVGWSQCNVTIIHNCTLDGHCATSFKPIRVLINSTGLINVTSFVEKMLSVYDLLFKGIQDKGNHSIPVNITLKVNDCYFVCGKKAYKWLPRNWSGSCFLGYLAPAIRHSFSLPQGKIRNVHAVNKPVNPVGNIDASWIYHHDLAHSSSKGLSHMDLGDDVISWAGILPAYGTVKSIWELRKLSKLLETLSNATFSALELVTDELTAMRTVVLQNRMALDFTLAAKGGTCALIQEECCSFIPDNEHDIDSHLEILQQVSELTKPGQNPLTDFFQNWFGNWGTVFMNVLIAVCVGAIIFLLLGCCCIPCIRMIISSVLSANATKAYYSEYTENESC